jgi:hypothetical protein
MKKSFQTKPIDDWSQFWSTPYWTRYTANGLSPVVAHTSTSRVRRNLTLMNKSLSTEMNCRMYVIECVYMNCGQRAVEWCGIRRVAYNNSAAKCWGRIPLLNKPLKSTLVKTNTSYLPAPEPSTFCTLLVATRCGRARKHRRHSMTGDSRSIKTGR